jgi:hypothetical protein
MTLRTPAARRAPVIVPAIAGLALSQLLAPPAIANAQAPREVLARASDDAEKVLPRPSTTTTEPDRPEPIRDEAPIPPKARPSDELAPSVTIRTEGGTRIEEYREGGRLVMVRVVPPVGIPYSYVDTDGDGRLEGDPGTLRGGVRPVYYTLYEWE